MPVLLKLVHNIETHRILCNSFYKATFTFIPKPPKDTTKKVYYKPIFLVNIYENILHKILAN